MDKLNTCYDPQAAMDFSQGRRAITPLNKHRWDLTLHAVLEFGKEHGKKVSLFLSAHQWKTRVPSEEEMEAIMQLGDAGALSVPSIIRICRKHAGHSQPKQVPGTESCERAAPTRKSQGLPGVVYVPGSDSRKRTPQKGIRQNDTGVRSKACRIDIVDIS